VKILLFRLLRCWPCACIATFYTLFLYTESAAQKQRFQTKINTHKHAIRRDKKPFGRKIYNSIGFSLNALNYYGDLAPRPQKLSTDIHLTRPGFGLSYIRKRGPRFTIKSEFIYGVIRGDDRNSANPHDKQNGIYRYRRNLSFRNHLKELSCAVIFDLFENHGFYHHRHEAVPYLFAGLAVFHHNPQAIAPATDLKGNPIPGAGQWIDLKPLGTEGQYSKLNPDDVNFGVKPYSSVQLAIPAGIGARIRINSVSDLWLELGFRYLFTDYIDDVSRNYVDLGALNSDLAKAMSYRTNELSPDQKTLSYTARDGQEYTVVPGYGYEHKDNKRGNSNDNDFIFITTIRFTHILNARMHKAKSR
jgi:hypothetical protein